MTLLRPALACCTVLAFAFSPLRASSASGSLRITYVECPMNLNGYSVPRVIVSNMYGSTIVQRSFPKTRAVALRELQIALPPGFYDVTAANGDCADNLPITLLPGHDRHVVALARSEGWLDRRHTMISGTLPSRGWQVAIVYRDLPRIYGQQSSSRDGYLQYPAQVEGDAYYAVGVPYGKFTVRLYNAWQLTWLDIDGGEIERTAAQRAIVRNVTEKDVMQKLNYLAHKAPTCVTLKSGVLVCTPPD